MATNQINLPKGFVLDQKISSDVNLPKGFVLDKEPSFFQQLKEEYQRGAQQDIQRLQPIKRAGLGLIAGLKEKWPQTIGATVATALPLATNLIPGAQVTPEEMLTIPAGQAAGQAVTNYLTRLALAYGGGAAGKAGQEAYRHVAGSEKAPKDIWQAMDRIMSAGEEELYGQAIGEIAAYGLSKGLAPFASRTTPGTPQLSRKLGRAAQRIPEEELAKMSPNLRKVLTAKTLLPRLYRDATGQLKFGRVSRIRELMTPSQKTISPALDWVENATESSIFGGGRIKLEKQYMQPAALKQLMGESVDEFWKQAGRRMSNTEIAELFTDAVTDSRLAWRSQQKIMYSQLDDLIKQAKLPRGAGGQFVAYKTVSTTSAKKMANNILEEATSNVGSATAKRRIANIVNKWDDSIDFKKAIDYRSDLLEELRKYETVGGLKSPKLQGAVERITSKLDDAMEQTAKNNGTKTYNMWRAANDFTKKGYEKFQSQNLINALHYVKKNPARVTDVFFQPYAQESIKELKKVVPDDVFNSMRAGWVEKQIKGATDVNGNILWRGFQKRLSEQALGKDMIAEVFPEKDIYKNLIDVAEIASIFQEKGGAGGGMVMQLTQAGQLVMSGVNLASGQPIKGKTLGILILGPLQMSRILTNRGGSKLLAEGFKTPIWSPQAAGLATRILKLYYGEEPIAPLTQRAKVKWQQEMQRKENQRWLEEFRKGGFEEEKQKPKVTFRFPF